MHMVVFSALMYVRHSRCSGKADVGVESPGTGVPSAHELPCGC